jgi:hypothetical protein
MPAEDRLLVTRLALLGEDESLTEEQHRALARPLSQVLQGSLKPSFASIT